MSLPSRSAEARLDHLAAEPASATVARFEAFQAGGGGRVNRQLRELHAVSVTPGPDAGVTLHFEDAKGGRMEVDRGYVELPGDWEGYSALAVHVGQVSGLKSIRVTVVGARCLLGETFDLSTEGDEVLLLTIDDLPLAAGKQPPWEPHAIRLEATGKGTLELRGMALQPRDRPAPPVVDRYGQRRSRDWPGKIRRDLDLYNAINEEAATLFAEPPAYPRTRYGGWKEGPTFAATGFFSVAQDDNGVAWFVDPDGHAFWSVGTTGIRIAMHNDATQSTGREALYAELPPRHGPYQQAWVEDDLVSFYTANVARKFGDFNAWARHVLRRFRALGFNTFGNWSHPLILEQTGIAHTRTLDTRGDGAPMAARRLADVFAPAWRDRFARQCEELAAPHRDNPWLLGYFVDNEMPWGRAAILDAAPTSALKEAWVQHLSDEIEQLDVLNAGWGTHYRDWEELREVTTETLPDNAAAVAMKRDFVGKYAEQYFRLVRECLKAADPNHLYLGCRFVRRMPDRLIVEAAGRHSDVVTVNCYSLYPARDEFDAWHAACGRPILIGEHHLPKASERQLPPLYPAFNEEERERFYIQFLQKWAERPYALGAHWFQHSDQPPTGRSSDGECQTVGFVDITDQPYPELVRAARQVTPQMHGWHQAAR